MTTQKQRSKEMKFLDRKTKGMKNMFIQRGRERRKQRKGQRKRETERERERERERENSRNVTGICLNFAKYNLDVPLFFNFNML